MKANRALKPTTVHVLCQMIDKRDARIAELEAKLAYFQHASMQATVDATPAAKLSEARGKAVEALRRAYYVASTERHDRDHSPIALEQIERESKAAPPVPGEKLRAGTETADDAARRFAGQCIEKDARIAELEANVASMRGVVKVATKLRDEGGKNLGTVDELHYALASLGLNTPAAKPDPRKGHVIPNAGEYVVGCDADGTPRTINGKPIDPKPDPLARAVTVGEFNEKMLRLANVMDKDWARPTSLLIRDIFTQPQGAEHGQ